MAPRKKQTPAPKTPPGDEPRVAYLMAIRNGLTPFTAAAAAGVTSKKVQAWRKEDKSFALEVKRAREAGKAALVACVAAAGNKSWQAAAWLLERIHHDEFTRIDRLTPRDLERAVQRFAKRLLVKLPESMHSFVREAARESLEEMP
jgi:hypothetical protein